MMRSAQRVYLLWFALLLVLACDRGPAERGGPPAPPTPVSAPTLAPSPRSSATARGRFRLPGVARVVAIGDLHGDLAAAQDVLRLAGATDQKDTWIGGDLVIVQTGDQIDRGDDDRALLDWLARIAEAARRAGGAVHLLSGNHEVMNVLGDFRYVSRASLLAFADVSVSPPLSPLLERFPATHRGRAAAFLPGGVYAVRLAAQPVALVVGDTVFVHGGLLTSHLDYGIDRLNADLESWMRGSLPRPPAALLDSEAPIWTRVYSDGDPQEDVCARLEQVLKRLDAQRMVVGHTVQKQGISSACAGHLWRIDVGLARAYGGRRQILMIRGDRVAVLPR